MAVAQHGLSHTWVAAVWGGMKARCYNPNSEKFPRYGARGITVCERWKASIEAFYDDMGDRPTENHSLDRIDNDGNYSCGNCDECRKNGWPFNCRWATAQEQRRNTSDDLLMVRHGGQEMLLCDLAKKVGIKYATLRYRILVVGMSAEDAVACKVLPGGGPLKSRNVKRIKFRGQEKTIKEWSCHLGINYQTLVRRLRLWGAEAALSLPVQMKYSSRKDSND